MLKAESILRLFQRGSQDPTAAGEARGIVVYRFRGIDAGGAAA